MTSGPPPTARTPIARGERAPDFALPIGDADEPTRFYGSVGGRPVVLVFAGNETGALTAGLTAAIGRQVGSRVDVVVVTGPRATTGTTDRTFHDATGKVHEAYGAALDGAQPIAVVLDPNVRVVAALPVGDADTAFTEIAAVLPDPPADGGLIAPRLAPVLFVPDALEVAVREELVDRWHRDGAVETGVETVVEGERAEATDVRRKRRRDIVVTDKPLLRELTQHVGARVFPELRKAFAFQAGGFEGFKVGCYTAEDRGYFEAHRDNLSAGTAHRRFGLTVNLNDDYEGGELRFPEYGAARYRPAAGEALVFSGSHLHEVLPVEGGRRFVLLSFVLERGGRAS